MVPGPTEAAAALLERLIRGIGEDGVPLTGLAAWVAAEHPEWQHGLSARDWRYHVPPAVRTVWPALDLTTRLCVYETAASIALKQPARERAPLATWRPLP